MPEPRSTVSIHRVLRRVTFGIGVVALVLLVVLAAIGLLTFVRTLFRPIDLEAAQLIQLLDIVLFVFVVIELMNIAIAFIEERRVIYRVFEAVLVAVARKIIVSGTQPVDLDKAASLALITLAVGITWWLVTHADLKSHANVASRGRGTDSIFEQPREQDKRRSS